MPRRTFLMAFLVVVAAALPVAALAQCMLANPSFEIAGSGTVFGGWNQFGAVGSSTNASHGLLAARVSGPNSGNWDVSGFWQPQSSAAGDVWDVAGTVRVPSVHGLAGLSRAIVNVEWRDGAGNLISYESHDVATTATLRDTALAFAFTTAAAPANTATVRLLLGVLQGPADTQGDAIYDRITFVKRTTPSLDDQQWGDFPGGRTLTFSGRTWRVKGPGYYGPGPNSFTDSQGAVYVDAGGSLHLTITKTGPTWYSTEVACTEALGYGDYVFTTRGRLDQLQTTSVLGLFLWEYGPCYDAGYLWWNPYNEIDVEFSRWGVTGGPDAQFVAQPYDWGGNRHQFSMSFSTNEVTSHAFRWRPDRVEFRSWRGGPTAESPGTTVNSWTYTGPHIPRPDQPRVHLNLWQCAGPPTATQEAILDAFNFTPWSPALLDAPAAAAPARLTLALASRNPSAAGATIRCTMPRAGTLRVTILDVSGRVIRRVYDGALEPGTHALTWDGRDDAGVRVPPGVYLCAASGAAGEANTRVVVLR